VDGDTVDITNVNRQLPALHSTVGKNKVEVVAERILDINPEVNLSRLMNFIARKNGRNAGKQ
jgi:tRNA A37 threonylcarbamoyladenosine dehydratase